MRSSTVRNIATGSPGTLRLRKLEGLRARIVREMYLDGWLEVAFWQDGKGVRGWQGTGDLFFVGLNPSYGCPFSAAFSFFYEELENHEFGNAHLTDVFKRRGKPEEAEEWIQNDDEFVQGQLAYLLEEVEILGPRLVVPMGEKCANVLRERGPEQLTHLLAEKPLPHYSWAFRYKREKRFDDAMKEIRKLYDGKVPPTVLGPPAYPRSLASSSP